MRKPGRRWPLLVLPSLGVLALLAGIIFGNFLQHPGTETHAAHVNKKTSTSSMQKGLNTSVLPMHPMYEMAVKMDEADVKQATSANQAAQAQAQANIPCLASTTAPWGAAFTTACWC